MGAWGRKLQVSTWTRGVSENLDDADKTGVAIMTDCEVVAK